MVWNTGRAFMDSTGSPQVAAQNTPAIRHKANGWLTDWEGHGELALLGSRGPGFSGRLGEIVVIGHAPTDVSVEVPLYRPRGKGALRVRDLFEHGVLGRFLRLDLVEDLKLLLQHRIRRSVEPHLVFGLELDVVLRVAVDSLPRHVLRRRLYGVSDDRSHLFRQRVELGLVE